MRLNSCLAHQEYRVRHVKHHCQKRVLPAHHSSVLLQSKEVHRAQSDFVLLLNAVQQVHEWQESEINLPQESLVLFFGEFLLALKTGDVSAATWSWDAGRRSSRFFCGDLLCIVHLTMTREVLLVLLYVLVVDCDGRRLFGDT